MCRQASRSIASGEGCCKSVVLSVSLWRILVLSEKKEHVKLAKSLKRKDATEHRTSYKSISFSLIIFEMINLLWYENDGLTKESSVNFVGKNKTTTTTTKKDRYYVVTHRDKWQRTECPSKTIHHDSRIALFSYFQIYSPCRLRALFQKRDTSLFRSAATSKVLTFSDMVQGLLQLANKWENIH